MGLFDWKNEKPKEENNSWFGGFSVPFLHIGKGTLKTPWIDYQKTNGWVRFGSDNLYPSILNQLYYTSPMHSQIIEFITSACGGSGYKIEPLSESGEEKTKIYNFERRIKLEITIDTIIRSYIIHRQLYFRLKKSKNNQYIITEIIEPSKCRVDYKNKICWISDNWYLQSNINEYKIYEVGCDYDECIYRFRDDSTHNQGFISDNYPIPTYTTANDWIYLDGEYSLLHKNSIIESIYLDIVVKYPRKIKSQSEKDQIREIFERSKGPNGKKIAILEANDKDDLPDIQSFQTNSNDKLFIETSKSMIDNICWAHGINPSIMGVAITGAMGQTDWIKYSLETFQNTTLLRIKRNIEYVMNDLLYICGIENKFKLNPHSIIDFSKNNNQ